MPRNERTRPLYRKIHEELAAQIREGSLAAGDKLPSEQELCGRYGVSKITVKQALRGLSEEGLIERIPGKGSFVRPPGPARGADRPDPPAGEGPLLIGLIMDHFGEPYGNRLIYAIEEECGRLGYRPVLFRSGNSRDKEEKAVADALKIGVAGLIINPVHGEFYSKVHLQLIIDDIPLVFVGNYLSGLAAPYSGTDNFEASRRAVRRLFDLGHRSVGFLSPLMENTYAIEQRRDGYLQAHSDAGLIPDPSLILEGLESSSLSCRNRANLERDINAVLRFLEENPRVTALFAEEYSVAVLAAEAAARKNLAVPEELSLVCFDCPEDWLGRFAFTHVNQDEKTMGINALNLLHKRIEGASQVEQLLIPGRFTDGGTLAPARPR